VIDSGIIYILCSLLIALLSGLFYGEKETIIRKRWQDPQKKIKTWADKKWFPKWLKVWWEANNYHYENEWLDNLMRYVLAPFKDGYHFSGSVGVALLILSMSFAYQVDNVYLLWLLAAGNFGFHGIGVNISYHDWIDGI